MLISITKSEIRIEIAQASSAERFQQQQSQEGSFEPFNAARNWAAAQPNPASTVIASVGQLRAHAPHSIHAKGLTTCAVLSV